MTFSVWFDGDETLWDRRGHMLTGLLDEPSHVDDATRAPELFPDVLPAMVDLAERGSVNLIHYAPMPAGHEHVLPPFAAHVDAPGAPSDLPPELHDTDDGRGRRGNMLVRDIGYYLAGFAMMPLAK